MQDLKKFFTWRKTGTLIALDILLLSSVCSLAAAADFPAFWSAVTAAVSTHILFAIAVYDWVKSAQEGADLADLREQVDQIERRVNRLEGRTVQAAE